MRAESNVKLRRWRVDLDSGWLEYPRPKTAIQRRAKLWIETIEALRLSLSRRRPPAISPGAVNGHQYLSSLLEALSTGTREMVRRRGGARDAQMRREAGWIRRLRTTEARSPAPPNGTAAETALRRLTVVGRGFGTIGAFPAMRRDRYGQPGHQH